MINGIVRSFQNVLNQDSGGQVRCILLYFEEKQNTNYFDQSEAVKAPINLLMYRSFRNSSATKIHCFHIKWLYLPKYTAHTLLHIFAVVFMFCHICDMTFNCDDIWGAGDSADYSHWRFRLPRQMLFFLQKIDWPQFFKMKANWHPLNCCCFRRWSNSMFVCMSTGTRVRKDDRYWLLTSPLSEFEILNICAKMIQN